ncbi:MAG: class I SAM-dependent methyltransferase [Phycisphaerales bacterium]|nr:class I SAM-dependent methyltransferase [Phycisphaerales bacterium]MCI0631911.1 class I SAM-dependent methyltransferase [Phycisphaerales bacterium]MCI0676441.1 class I SAM-dependent methyltransferase [Phycisphaerales bacterium]
MVGTTFPVQTTVEYFESIYVDAQGDATRIPWADERPQPALVNWLNAVAPSLVRSGSRVVAVGCGLGEDARELMRRGYDVTAFDCSKTAVDWARKLDPMNARCYTQADLFHPPPRWRHRFDLVVEINTIQSLAPEQHASAIRAMTDLMSPHGHMLVIARCSDEPVTIDDGPPWALTRQELLEAAAQAALAPTDPVAVFEDDEDPPVQRMRALLARR